MVFVEFAVWVELVNLGGREEDKAFSAFQQAVEVVVEVMVLASI